MKKILTIIGLVSVTTLLHAQGYIDFTGTSAAISTNTGIFLVNGGETSGTTGKTGASSSGQVYDFALLYSATSITGNSAPTNTEWTLATVFGGGTLIGTNNVLNGSVQGNGGSSGVELANMVSGTAYNVELVGWSTNLGTSWSTVSTELNANSWTLSSGTMGFFGYETVGSVTPGSSPTGGGDPTIFTSIWSNGTMSLYEVPVPEPATIALAGLGGLSMLLLRRRNKA